MAVKLLAAARNAAVANPVHDDMCVGERKR